MNIMKTKEDSILDFTHLTLEELETKVEELFPNDLCAESFFHCTMLDALTFRFLSNGWTVKELKLLFKDMVNNSVNNLKEFEAEELSIKQLH